jgi:hypothetical protein
MYDEITETINEHGVSWSDVDRVILTEERYDEFIESAPFQPSNYATDDNPAVRRSNDTERVVYISDRGAMKELEV